MKGYLTFLKNYPQQALFGWLLTFFSSYGQTFLISLFVPYIINELELTKTAFGGYYAVSTVIASFVLLRFGHIVDERPVRPFTYKSISLLILSCLLLAFTVHPAMLFFALIGLRLAGQGLMSHISMSVMSRYFTDSRGKALSFSSLGFSIGEMIFPVLLGGIISLLDWRWAAGSALLILGGAVLLLSKMDLEELDEKPHLRKDKKGNSGKLSFFFTIMKGRNFWVLAPPVFTMSFVVTGFFFFQYIMAEDMGWPLEMYSLFFAGYGAVRLFFSLYGGVLIDRFSAKKLFPFYLFPMALGVLCIALLPGLIAAGAFLFLTGITVGGGGNIKAAVIAEKYGVDNIGKVRSLFTVVMVISTAAAPLLFGALLDAGFEFSHIAYLGSGLLGVVILNNFRI